MHLGKMGMAMGRSVCLLLRDARGDEINSIYLKTFYARA